MLKIFCDTFTLTVFSIILFSCTYNQDSYEEKLSDELSLKEVSFDKLQGWEDDSHGDVIDSFRKSCRKWLDLSQDYNLGYPAGSVSDWLKICNKAFYLTNKKHTAKAFFEANFTPYMVGNKDNYTGLFTGYYEPLLAGKRIKDDIYKYAIYRLPESPQAFDFSRKEIESGALANQNFEILYVNNPVDLFFLHIQGSGRVKLEDDTVIRIGYAGKNNHPYKSIGQYLVEKGVLELKEVTAPKIRNWLKENPEKAESVMSQNASYVFFREINGDGPIGSQDVVLTPERSLAVDKRFIPYGIPIWLDTIYPSGKPYRRILISQDTGGAIKNPVRGDIFFGFGKGAEFLAGYMKEPGRYYILLPNAIKPFLR